MAQTAVDWLIEEIKNFDSGRSQYYSKTAIYNHAYRIEKEQIMEAYHEAINIEYSLDMQSPREYYEKTYTNGL